MSSPRRVQRPRQQVRSLAVVPAAEPGEALPLPEQVEAWAARLLSPPARQLSWANAVAVVRAAFRPTAFDLTLDLARGEGRTHLARRWAPHGLCGARLDASDARGVTAMCEVCASLLPPEAD